MRWSTWSTTTVCGGVSGSLLASGTAGGWPLLMGPRLAIPYGGRRGSSAEGQGDVLGTTVDTCSASSCAYAVFFFNVKVNSDPEVVGLALWRVGNHAEWRSAHSRSFSCLPCFRTWNLDNIMSPLYLAVPVRCLVSAQCLVRLRIHVLRLQDGFWKYFMIFDVIGGLGS